MWRCDFREKRIVLIVSVLLPINIDLALCSNTQRRVDVLRMCQVPILQGVATTLIMFMSDAKVEDQAASRVSQVVPDHQVAAPLVCAGHDAELPTVRTLCPAVQKRGLSEDRDRCFSTLVLGAFRQVFFNANALPRIQIGADVWSESG